MELRKPINCDFHLLIFLSMFACFNIGTLSSDGENLEVQALMEFKASVSDPYNVLANWDANSDDPCNWAMVTCSSTGHVSSLGAADQSLSGELSPSIGNLSDLQSLLLQNNNLTGAIPPAVGNLSRLQQLDLSNNLLTGLIPSSLDGLTSLQYMRLGNNSLSGAIPSSLQNLTKLALLDLSYNNLSGPVPKISAKTFMIVGNPICQTGSELDCSQMYYTPPVMPLKAQASGKYKSQIALVVGLSLGSLCLLALAFGLFLWWRRRSNQNTFSDVDDWYHEEIGLRNLKRFPFKELQIGTENFSNKNLLGKGGYGDVYKGRLQDGTVVAVKRLKDGSAAGGVIQFQTELETISLAVHRNLIRLYGFCITTKERLLVYQYMSNGSVFSRLKEKPVLDWGTRKRIALGAARGLLYLHEQCDPKIIHRDVKAANILLDDNCEAVVGDFGLAKLLDHEESHVTTAVRGTIGHIAPEYLSTGQSSDKTDVFGFGILLLELITGQRALEFGKAASEKGFLLDLVKKIHQEKKLDLLVDKNLKNNYDDIEVEEMVQIALLCTQFLPVHRPKMSEIVRTLEGDQLAERWDSSQTLDSLKNKSYEFSFEQYPDLIEDSSVFDEAIELSGPR